MVADAIDGLLRLTLPSGNLRSSLGSDSDRRAAGAARAACFTDLCKGFGIGWHVVDPLPVCWRTSSAPCACMVEIIVCDSMQRTHCKYVNALAVDNAVR